MNRVLVTGGTGYIGSHTCLELLESGFDVVAVDNLSNSSPRSLERVAEITGRRVTFIEADLLDAPAIEQIVAEHQPASVIHFAGCKAVGESMKKPLKYFRNNVGGSLNLLEAMQRMGVRRLVFSSTCTVHGNPDEVPIREDAPLGAVHPYGASKLMVEELLRGLARRDSAWRFSILRYFNPVGAHPSGRLGEDPAGEPENLMPYIMQVAAGKRERLRVFGNSYETRDGTGVRDYLHVCDLARGHLHALRLLEEKSGVRVHNLGSGRGYTVLEVVEAFEQATGVKIPYDIVEPRAGDVAETWADTALAARELGWKAERDLPTMCEDTWRWQRMNPGGYAS